MSIRIEPRDLFICPSWESLQLAPPWLRSDARVCPSTRRPYSQEAATRKAWAPVWFSWCKIGGLAIFQQRSGHTAPGRHRNDRPPILGPRVFRLDVFPNPIHHHGIVLEF